jgi:hypothetical protein
VSALNTHPAVAKAEVEPLPMTTITETRRPVKSDSLPYSQADLDWAAQAFGDAEADRLLEEQALQAAWDDQFNGTLPGPGHCLQCGDFADLTASGLCEACDLAATEMSAGMRPAFDRLV